MTDFTIKANEVFANTPHIEVLYFTSDGLPFIELEKANGHVSKLRNDSITEIYRPDISKAEITRRRATHQNEQTLQHNKGLSKALPEYAASIKSNKTPKLR